MGSVGKRVTVTVASTLVLLSTAACGSDKGPGEEERKPLGKAELSSAVLTQGDVPGYTISDESDSNSDRSARASNKACQPIVAAMFPATAAFDGRVVLRSIVQTPKGSERPEASYQLVLSSAESESAARQAVQDLRSAVSACASGFKATLSGEEYKMRRAVVNKSDAGDNSVDFSLEYQMGAKVHYVMMQNGASLIRVSASNQFANEFVAVPSKIIKAQQQKLNKVNT
ncbi:hypothetical protein ACLVWQ_40030 [Streptomyces sp. CWNU-52B]|uniref:hypothetical protein n=1 Tax=unclassified Streptomyces TaxID=2593676 RepID=UPI0039BEFA17